MIDAVIDTGFSGFLTLPSDTISTLGFSWEDRDVATLGDGTFCTFEVYVGLVIWDGQYREIYIKDVVKALNLVCKHQSELLIKWSEIHGS
jgi:predicted aspartyl protease